MYHHHLGCHTRCQSIKSQSRTQTHPGKHTKQHDRNPDSGTKRRARKLSEPKARDRKRRKRDRTGVLCACTAPLVGAPSKSDYDLSREGLLWSGRVDNDAHAPTKHENNATATQQKKETHTRGDTLWFVDLPCAVTNSAINTVRYKY